VQITKASFPKHQLLANSANLELAVKNTGSKTVPDLAVTIYTGKIPAGVSATGTGQGSFNVRLNDPTLAIPNRPVWDLEHGYPKVLPPGTKAQDIHKAPSAGAIAAQTDTFQFGSVAPGKTKDIVWHVTPVRAGTYPLHYRVAAGLQGKAKAVTASGGPAGGTVNVTIASRPPETCVKGLRKVSTNCRSS
jgi:hypothetical protein